MVVDRQRRRRETVDAVYRVITRDGLAAATVRAVAGEAGVSTGSLRYFFSSQHELLTFAMQTVVDRAGERVASRQAERLDMVARGEVVGAIVLLLEETLPLDAERRREALIWHQFTAAAVNDRRLSAISRNADEQVRLLCQHAVDSLRDQRMLAPGRDPRAETLRLWALLDGLTLRLLTDDGLLTPADATAILTAQLAELAGPPRR